MVSGIHDFFSERRDKYRIFTAGLKVAKRKKSDLNRFKKLQFIANSIRMAILESTTNYVYVQDIFYEAILKFNRTDDDCNALYNLEYPNIFPQIFVPTF